MWAVPNNRAAETCAWRKQEQAAPPLIAVVTKSLETDISLKRRRATTGTHRQTMFEAIPLSRLIKGSNIKCSSIKGSIVKRALRSDRRHCQSRNDRPGDHGTFCSRANSDRIAEVLSFEVLSFEDLNCGSLSF
jgi:hypothetical protein